MEIPDSAVGEEVVARLGSALARGLLGSGAGRVDERYRSMTLGDILDRFADR